MSTSLDFTFEGQARSVERIDLKTNGDLRFILNVAPGYDINDAEGTDKVYGARATLYFVVGSGNQESSFSLNDAIVPVTQSSRSYSWGGQGLSWSSGQSVPLRLEQRTVSDAPANLAWTPGDGQVTLNWEIQDDGGSSITKIQYRQKEAFGSFGNWMDITSSEAGGTNATSYAVDNLTNGVAYTFQLQALNNVGTSDASDELVTRAGEQRGSGPLLR